MGLIIQRAPQRGLRVPVTGCQTFAISAPLGGGWWRPATCAELNCLHYLNGWAVRVEALTPDLVHAARNSGRRYREVRVAGGETWLAFEAGQPCFKASEHRVRTARPERYLLSDGDRRGNPTGRVREFTRPDDWVDASANHMDRLTTLIGRG